MTGSTVMDPMSAIRQFVDGFNAWDVDLMQAACTEEMAIIDDFPPHEWSGRGAVTSWARDMARLSAEFGMTEPSVALEDPRHVVVTDLRAYVVVPVEVRWLDNGTPAERAGTVTASLREEGDGWRISAWAWTWS